MRLIAAQRPAHEVRKAQARAHRNAQKAGRTIQPQTLLVAGWVVLITTLSARHWSADAVLRVYRVRWQIELVFKRLLRARLTALTHDAGWVLSSWGLTTLSVDVLRQQVRGGWGSQRVQACLPRLQRFLTSRIRRDRTHQETTVRTWLDRRPRYVTEEDSAYPDACVEREDTLS
ncbi:MAG: transposase [Oscillochloris sp.]|nr:transposase [Oscillochloris sp.]